MCVSDEDAIGYEWDRDRSQAITVSHYCMIYKYL